MSRDGQIHGELKTLVNKVEEQTRRKLMSFEFRRGSKEFKGYICYEMVVETRVYGYMAIAKTASRSVAFKVARLRESIILLWRVRMSFFSNYYTLM